MKKPIKFTIEKKLPGTLARAGVIDTPHGKIQTPAFVTVGTKATVKSLTPEMVKDLGGQVVLANTYHLYLEPGHEMVAKMGGLNKMMNWDGPTMTDSGGFQVFSLGAAFGEKVGKLAMPEKKEEQQDKHSHATRKEKLVSGDGYEGESLGQHAKLAKIDEDGVTFKSYRDGSEHRFTPERSIEIQHNIGADMIFVFDECTSPAETYEYQKQAWERTERWAKRCLDYHQSKENSERQALFGIVQGGRHEDLRKLSATKIGAMDFDGFGIGGSFDKEDMFTAVRWVNEILPEEKPRHLLGIGEPLDLFGAVENGCDLFDCVLPTRLGRNGTLLTSTGKIHISNKEFQADLTPIEEGCGCYSCKHYTKAYIAHLFRSGEMLAGTLSSIHNLYFLVHLVDQMRAAILDGTFLKMKEDFFAKYDK